MLIAHGGECRSFGRSRRGGREGGVLVVVVVVIVILAKGKEGRGRRVGVDDRDRRRGDGTTFNIIMCSDGCAIIGFAQSVRLSMEFASEVLLSIAAKKLLGLGMVAGIVPVVVNLRDSLPPRPMLKEGSGVIGS